METPSSQKSIRFLKTILQNWSELLPELLVEIAKRIDLLPAQVSFASVCKSWHSAAATLDNFNLSTPRFPCLLLGETEEDNSSSGGVRRLFIQTPNGKGKIAKILLPEASASKSRCYSSRGWLLVVAENNIDVALIHPFTRRQIQLPKLDTIPGYVSVTTMVLVNPSSTMDDFIVVLNVFKTTSQEAILVFYKPGDASWSKLNLRDASDCIFSDMIYDNRRMYLVTLGFRYEIKIYSCDLGEFSKSRKLTKVSKVPREFDDELMWGVFLEGMRMSSTKLYISGRLPNDDKLFFVARKAVSCSIDDLKTCRFLVYEISTLADGKFFKVESLGNRALFLGLNSSFCVEADGCAVKPNCIYFTEDWFPRIDAHRVGTNMGIYHLADGTIEPLCSWEPPTSISPSVWVEPRPC